MSQEIQRFITNLYNAIENYNTCHEFSEIRYWFLRSTLGQNDNFLACISNIDKQRQIKSFADLDNLQVVAEITINDKGDQPRNEIKTIITPDHARYNEFMDERSGKFPINYTQANNKQIDNQFISDEVPF